MRSSTLPGRSWPNLVVSVCALLATTIWHQGIWHQEATAQPFGFAASSTTNREELFRDLARDVEALDRQLSIYKRVAVLLSPSVVHIDATPLPRYHFSRSVEEAGSGILVRVHDNNYVLTNRGASDSAADTERAERDATFVIESTKEDRDVVQGIQASLPSEANDHFTYGKFEKGIVHFHKTLTDMLARS